MCADEADEFIRVSFINGICSPHFRQRLLETNTLTLQKASEYARVLKMAQYHLEYYTSQFGIFNTPAAAPKSLKEHHLHIQSQNSYD